MPTRRLLLLALLLHVVTAKSGVASASSVSVKRGHESDGNVVLFETYRRQASAAVEQTIRQVRSTVVVAVRHVRSEYSAAERQLLLTVRGAVDTCSSAEAKKLLRVDIPAWISGVNRTINRAVVRIYERLAHLLRDCRNVYNKEFLDILHVLKSAGGEPISAQVARISRLIRAGNETIEGLISWARTWIKLEFFGPNVVVQGFIALVERHVHSALPQISGRVNKQLLDASVRIDNTEQLCIRTVWQLLEVSMKKRVSSILQEFLDELQRKHIQL